METRKVEYWDVYVDGASLAAEKRAAAGIVLYRPNGEATAQQGVLLPSAQSSHEAEYQAVIAGIALAKKHKVTHLRLHCDCAHVVGQLRGTTKVNSARLKQLHTAALARAKQLAHVEYVSIDRAQNALAHKLANEALSAV